jgi:hypothetical protein
MSLIIYIFSLFILCNTSNMQYVTCFFFYAFCHFPYLPKCWYPMLSYINLVTQYTLITNYVNAISLKLMLSYREKKKSIKFSQSINFSCRVQRQWCLIFTFTKQEDISSTICRILFPLSTKQTLRQKVVSTFVLCCEFIFYQKICNTWLGIRNLGTKFRHTYTNQNN